MLLRMTSNASASQALPANSGTPDNVPKDVTLCRTSPMLHRVPPLVIVLLPQMVFTLNVLLFVTAMIESMTFIPFEVYIWPSLALHLVAFGVLGGKAFRTYFRSTSLAPVSKKPDPDSRVNIALYADQRRQLLPLRDESFEPMMFRVLRSSLPMTSRKGGSKVSKSADVSSILSCVNPLWLLLLMAWGVPMSFMTPGWMQTLAILALGGASLALLLHPRTYLRVVPGRVDIMRVPTLGWGVGPRPSVESIDLRGSRVLMDLRSAQLILDPVYDPPPGPLATDAQRDEHRARAARQRLFHFGTAQNRETAMIAIARAAVSTAEPGDLPNDKLAG